jgi:hypothetical protein
MTDRLSSTSAHALRDAQLSCAHRRHYREVVTLLLLPRRSSIKRERTGNPLEGAT